MMLMPSQIPSESQLLVGKNVCLLFEDMQAMMKTRMIKHQAANLEEPLTEPQEIHFNLLEQG